MSTLHDERGESTRRGHARPATLDRAADHRDDLNAQLDAPLPDELAVGGGTALFVCGTCFAPGARIASLSLRRRRRGAAA